MIWSILLKQHSMLHHLFTIGVNGKMSGGWIHLMPTVDIALFETQNQMKPLMHPLCIPLWKVDVGAFYYYKDSIVPSIEVEDNRGILAMARMQDNPREEIALDLKNKTSLQAVHIVKNFQLEVVLIICCLIQQQLHLFHFCIQIFGTLQFIHVVKLYT